VVHALEGEGRGEIIPNDIVLAFTFVAEVVHASLRV
jgi:hypothetical protein